jgi:hypothetical protein
MNAFGGARREASFGTLMSRSFENLWTIRKEVAIYLVVVAVCAFTLPLLGVGVTGGGGFVAYLAGQYWLYQSFLKARGMLETPRYHLFAFFLLAAMLIFPIMFGLAALLLPGLFLVARWIAAPCFVAARGDNAIAASGASWDAVRGHTAKLAGAVVTMFLITSALSVVTGGLGGVLSGMEAYTSARPLDLIEAHLLPLLLLGLSTATYELLGPEDTMIEDVFG